MNRTEFTNKIRTFVDAPYALDDRKKGWDCLNAMDEIFRLLGKNFPREFKGINESNYAEAWKSGKGKKLYREFLLSLGTSVDRHFAMEGDLFIFDGTETSFPGIYLGRNNLLMVFDKGVKVVPLKIIKELVPLIDVRRL